MSLAWPSCLTRHLSKMEFTQTRKIKFSLKFSLKFFYEFPVQY